MEVEERSVSDAQWLALSACFGVTWVWLALLWYNIKAHRFNTESHILKSTWTISSDPNGTSSLELH
jgi:hypothetical protein